MKRVITKKYLYLLHHSIQISRYALVGETARALKNITTIVHMCTTHLVIYATKHA
jgi:hypothetical protein